MFIKILNKFDNYYFLFDDNNDNNFLFKEIRCLEKINFVYLQYIFRHDLICFKMFRTHLKEGLQIEQQTASAAYPM